MRKTLHVVCTVTLLALGALSSAAAPIPLSAVGIGKSITVSARPYPILGGGGFSATIEGFETIIWCVDIQNGVTLPSTYMANVILLGDWPDGKNALVNKGTNVDWTDGLDLTPLQRYQGSAFLLPRFSGFPKGPDANTNANRDVQKAIWRLTHEEGSGGTFYAANDDYDDAVKHVSNPANAKFGWGKWAVISGPVDTSGNLGKDQIQTFMVQVANVPEPATYGLIGLALCGLALVRRFAMHS